MVSLHGVLPVLVVLLAALVLSAWVARRVHLPQPVLLSLLGLGFALVPGAPQMRLDPDLILVVFLPPILYADACDTSWVDFRRWLRPILMLAVGLVGFTILGVGLVTHALLPELPWAACFLLGAIVSPTDTVAVLAVVQTLRVPRRLTAILGGESLVNDATGLVGVQLAVAVILSGAFEAGEVAWRFAWVAGGGVGIGLALGAGFALLNRIVRTTRNLFVLSLLAPYAAYLAATGCGCSGVLAVVVAGFLVAWRIHVVPPAARVDLYATWSLVVWMLNGLCFVFIGIEAPHLVGEAAGAGGRLLVAGLAVGATAILCRILWIFPAAYLPLLFLPRTRAREGGYPPVRNVAVASWCGVRGVVSLAAALSVPTLLPDGRPFPGREELLAATLCVILLTLLVQGLTLGPLVRRLGIRGDDDTEAEVRAAREAVLEAGIRRLDELSSETRCPPSVDHWRNLLADELDSLRDEDAERRELARMRMAVSLEVRRAVAERQSSELLRLRDAGRINDRTYHALQFELDRGNPTRLDEEHA
jgi:CPA1 family monovalent cation:H+ antiporter